MVLDILAMEDLATTDTQLVFNDDRVRLRAGGNNGVDVQTADALATTVTIGEAGTSTFTNMNGPVNGAQPNSMAYLAIQFSSEFVGVRGQGGSPPIADDPTDLPDGTVFANFTFIEYTALFGGTRVTMVDRVLVEDVGDLNAGLTVTRRFACSSDH